MQLRLLSTFIAIAEAGTLTAAAGRVYKTQGAVSHDLRLLERDLGVTLVDRSGQRVRLTEAGEALLPLAQELLQRAADVQAEMRRINRGDIGVIRIGALPSLGSAAMRQILRFRANHPDVRFALFSELQALLVEWLCEGRLDMMIGEPELNDHLEGTLLGPEPLYVVMRHDHPLATRPSLRGKDLEDQPFLGFSYELGAGRMADKFFEPCGAMPDPVVEVDTYELMLQLLRNGEGYALMPRSTVPLAADDPLVAIEADPPLTRHVFLFKHRGRLLSPVALAFHGYVSAQWSFVPGVGYADQRSA